MKSNDDYVREFEEFERINYHTIKQAEQEAVRQHHAAKREQERWEEENRDLVFAARCVVGLVKWGAFAVGVLLFISAIG